jgi:hypothetical protein
MPLTTRRFPFSAENVNRSPREPGVYALYDASGNTELIGRTRTVGETLRDLLHQELERSGTACTFDAVTFAWEATSDPARREFDLLAEYREEFGDLPPCNRFAR